MKNLNPLSLILLIALAATAVSAQQSPRDKGIDLYYQGKYVEAINVLETVVKQPEFKTDAKAWNSLGLSLMGRGYTKKAIKALKKSVELAPLQADFHLNLAYAYIIGQKINPAQSEIDAAIKLDPKNPSAYLLRGSTNLMEKKLDAAIRDCDQVIAIDPSYASAYTLKSNVLMARLGQRLNAGSRITDEVGILRDAFDVLRAGEKTSSTHPGFKSLQEQLEAIGVFYKYFSTEKNANLDLSAAKEPNVTPVKITSKPRAAYTDAARQSNTQGDVNIAVLFAATGEVRHVLVLQSLPHGLS